MDTEEKLKMYQFHREIIKLIRTKTGWGKNELEKAIEEIADKYL